MRICSLSHHGLSADASGVIHSALWYLRGNESKQRKVSFTLKRCNHKIEFIDDSHRRRNFERNSELFFGAMAGATTERWKCQMILCVELKSVFVSLHNFAVCTCSRIRSAVRRICRCFVWQWKNSLARKNVGIPNHWIACRKVFYQQFSFFFMVFPLFTNTHTFFCPSIAVTGNSMSPTRPPNNCNIQLVRYQYHSHKPKQLRWGDRRPQRSNWRTGYSKTLKCDRRMVFDAMYNRRLNADQSVLLQFKVDKQTSSFVSDLYIVCSPYNLARRCGRVCVCVRV